MTLEGLDLQQVLTWINLSGFVRNSRERFLLPLFCLFVTCVCRVLGCMQR